MVGQPYLTIFINSESACTLYRRGRCTAKGGHKDVVKAVSLLLETMDSALLLQDRKYACRGRDGSCGGCESAYRDQMSIVEA